MEPAVGSDPEAHGQMCDMSPQYMISYKPHKHNTTEYMFIGNSVSILAKGAYYHQRPLLLIWINYNHSMNK